MKLFNHIFKCFFGKNCIHYPCSCLIDTRTTVTKPHRPVRVYIGKMCMLCWGIKKMTAAEERSEGPL